MTRIALQIGLILLPFMLFALYRLTTADKKTFGEKWPFALLAGIGLAISASFYIFLFLNEPREQRTCATPPRFENGQIVKGEVVPCESAPIDERQGKGLFGTDDN